MKKTFSLEKVMSVVEEEMGRALTELEFRNEKQLGEMEQIKNRVNECIRELFENFEIDIEETYSEKRPSISARLKDLIGEPVIEEDGNAMKKAESEKEAERSGRPSEREFEDNENCEDLNEPEDREDMRNSEVRKSDENQIHDISFSVNQSHEIKNQVVVFINGAEQGSGQRMINGEGMAHQGKRPDSKWDVVEIREERKEGAEARKEVLTAGKSIERRHDKAQDKEKKEDKLIERNAKKQGQKPEKNKRGLEKRESGSIEESEKKPKPPKAKDMALKSYMAPHSATNRTVQDYINNSSCKKPPLNESSNINKAKGESSSNNLCDEDQTVHEKSNNRSLEDAIYSKPKKTSQASQKTEKIEENTSRNHDRLPKNHDKIDRSNEKATKSNEKATKIHEKIDKNHEKIDKNHEKIDKSTEKIDKSTEKIDKTQPLESTTEKSHSKFKSPPRQDPSNNYSSSHIRNKSDEYPQTKPSDKSRSRDQENKTEVSSKQQDCSSERLRELTPNSRKSPNKFLNYYYFFEEKK